MHQGGKWDQAYLAALAEFEIASRKLAWRINGNDCVWGEHPGYTLSDWQYQVSCDYTRSGYWQWVLSCLQKGEEEQGENK